MNTKIDKNLPVSWCLELDNGERWFDSSTQPRAWIKAKEKIKQDNLKVRRMHLFATANSIDDTSFNGAITPEYADGYFFSHKTTAMFGGPSIETYAIGHFDPERQKVNIRWYTDTMSLLEQEYRPIDRATLGYVKNNLQ